MLSYPFWEERFGSNPSVIGQTLKLNQQSFAIIGVTPPAFNSTQQVGYYPSITIPLAAEPLLRGERTNLGTGSEPRVVVECYGPAQTWSETRTSARESEYCLSNFSPRCDAAAAQDQSTSTIEPKDYPRLIVEPGDRGMLDRRKMYAPTIYGLFIVVALVLLIACVNLANLLLARAELRGPEIRIRLAVGAGRWRLIRQLLTESLLLATLGGVVGVLFALWFKGALSAFTNDDNGLLPSGVELSLNWRVLGFTLAVSLLTGVLFGLAPAWRATNLDLNSTLKQSGRTTASMSRLSKGLLVVQVAVSALLLVGAGLFIRTLYNLQRVNLGFNQENLLIFTVQPELNGYKDEQLLRFYQGDWSSNGIWCASMECDLNGGLAGNETGAGGTVD